MNRPNGKTLAIVIGVLAAIGASATGWLYVRSADACERIAIVETRQSGVDASLKRIDATLLRMDDKLADCLKALE